MDTARATRRPWRSWTVIALVLATLALAQACGDSGHRTSGPTRTTAVGLKVHRAAQIPANCTGTLSIDAPNGFHREVSIPSSGEVTIEVPIGVLVTLTAVITCNPGGTFTGSTTFMAGPGNNQATLTVVATSAGVACTPNPTGTDGVSACACTIQSPGPATITWTGPVSPTTGPATTFKDGPGSHTVTCIVNGGASASTTVTVPTAPIAEPTPPAPPPPPATAIRIRNNDGTLNLRAIFSGGPQNIPPINSLGPGGSATRNVQAGTYDVEILFDNDGFLHCTNDTIPVNSNQTQTRSYSFPASCD